MSIFFRYFLRICSSIVSGSYFGFSTLSLIFGIYFATLTGLWLLIPAIWLPACIILSVVRGLKEERRDQGRRIHLEGLLKRRQEELKEWKEKLGQSLDDAAIKLVKPKKKPSTFLGSLWNKATDALEIVRTFVTGIRDSARSILSVLMIAGVLSAAALISLGPLLFAVVLGVCLILGGAAVIDAYLRRSHQSYQKTLTASIVSLEKEIAACQASQLPELPQTDKAKKLEEQLDSILNRPSKPNRNPYSTKRKITNVGKYGIKLFTGSVNGGYFGFTVFSLIFGIILMPVVGGLFGLAVS